MNSQKDTKLSLVLSFTAAAILILLPFHAVFTTWLGATFGHIDLFCIWKELLLIPMSLAALWLVYKDQKLRNWFINSRLVFCIVMYCLLTVILSGYALATNRVSTSAVIYALLINLRFLGFFLVCFVASFKSGWLRGRTKTLVLWPALVVIAFGLMQQFILPANILSHVGYGPKTIVAYQTVDQKPDYVRIQSTLRGPNPLGAYLLFIITLLVGFVLRVKKQKVDQILLLIGAVIVLFFTYSRSAWLGTVLSVGLLAFWSIKNTKLKQWLVVGGVVAIIVLGGVVFMFRNNDTLQNTVFHTDEHSRSSISSNQQRTSNLEGGVQDILHEPLGRGPGTAGPASVRNAGRARIAEDYYLQIGQEVGVLGLGLFIAINLLLALELFKMRQDTYAIVLLASLAGLTLVNLLSHAWADDTISLMWWGLAGIVVAPAILKPKGTANGKIKTT